MNMTIEPEKFGKSFLLILALVISVVFLVMVRGFVSTILLAAIFSGLAYPIYTRIEGWMKGRKAWASVTTVVLVFLLIIVPALGLIGLVTSEAIQVSQTAGPWVERQVSQPDRLDELFQGLPFYDTVEPYKDLIVSKVGEFVARAGSFLVSKLAVATRGTAVFFFQLFIMLYAMFFFLLDGRDTLNKILYYVPLTSANENRMVDRFLSVARATIKGTLVIGLIQGFLAGLAFWVLGIEGAFFWATIMAVMSIIPGIGAALVWVPAVVYLVAVGRPIAAVGLTVWCAGVVGTVDNLLRPRMVGKDTKMSDLMILLGTLGGISLFGAKGIVIGPIIAALFVTVWEIYGEVFKDVLPKVERG